MTSRRPSFAFAAAMRASISSSESPTYASGSGWRSEMCSFSYSVRSGISVDMVYCKYIWSQRTQALPRRHEGRINQYLKELRVLRVLRGLRRNLDAGVSDDVVERVALEWRASCRGNQALDLFRRHRFRRARTGHVVDLLF